MTCFKLRAYGGLVTVCFFHFRTISYFPILRLGRRGAEINHLVHADSSIDIARCKVRWYGGRMYAYVTWHCPNQVDLFKLPLSWMSIRQDRPIYPLGSYSDSQPYRSLMPREWPIV